MANYLIKAHYLLLSLNCHREDETIVVHAWSDPSVFLVLLHVSTGGAEKNAQSLVYHNFATVSN